MDKEVDRDIYFARRVLDSINMVDEPKLCYKEEKDIVAKALRKYITDLEAEARFGDRGNW